MAKPFDATLNALIGEHLTDWADFLARRIGLPPGPAVELDTDVSSTLQADRLFRIDGGRPVVVHVEFESGGRRGMPAELLAYSVAARARLGWPVRSVVVLLRPKATATDLTGVLELDPAPEVTYLVFRYDVVRVWREPLATFLGAGVGLAPLALLTNEAANDLPAAFSRLRARLRAAAVSDAVERGLLGSTFFLCGLRYTDDQIAEVYADMSLNLEESSTYQMVFNKGKREGVAEGVAEGELRASRRHIVRLATDRFGPPPAAVEAAILAITDRDRLDHLLGRVLSVAGWDELLG